MNSTYNLDNIQTTHYSSTNSTKYRYPAIDIIRGLVIILMALDHVREFFYYPHLNDDPLSQGAEYWPLYFTRWITHLCAPSFIFLAGISAGLMAERKSSNTLARFLILRGFWLIFMEMSIVTIGWTFSLYGISEINGEHFIILAVIWAIGASMVVLGVLQYLPVNIVLGVGLGIIFGHNFLDYYWPVTEKGGMEIAPFWVILHTQGSIIVENFRLFFYYPVIPWIGVMALGYGCARLYNLPSQVRVKALTAMGITFISCFILLRFHNLYGNPVPWYSATTHFETFLNILNVEKYPPSAAYLSITLGICFLLLSMAESWQGPLSKVMQTFGKVPFLFYIAHLYLIHLLAALFGLIQGYSYATMFNFFAFYPKDWGVSLAWVYWICLLVLIMLYPLCSWFCKVKRLRKEWWLSYL